MPYLAILNECNTVETDTVDAESFAEARKGKGCVMNTQQSNNISSLPKSTNSGRIIVLTFLVGIFGLLLGTLIRPSEAAQNYEIRISSVERQLNQMQFTFTQLDRRISQIENQSYGARTQPAPSQQPGASEVGASINERRIDELQSQLQTQGKMITELYKMIEGKQKPPAKEEQDEKKKPSLAGKPKP